MVAKQSPNKRRNKSYPDWRQLISLLCCCLLMLSVAISKNQKIAGHSLVPTDTTKTASRVQTLHTESDGTKVISTQLIAKDITGFEGNVPLEISIKGGRIVNVKALENDETPDFFDHVKQSGLLSSWNGLTPKQALLKQVDAVSGATYSSTAVIQTMQRGLGYAIKNEANQSCGWDKILNAKTLCALAIVVAGCILPLFIRSRKYRTVQLFLNVIVLGLWSRNFLSYSLIVGFLSNGTNLWQAIVPLLMLVAAFIYPLFGKKSHYCLYLCPLGSLQEICGKTMKKKWHTGVKLQKALTLFREILWAALMLVMWTGLTFSWMDYELFSLFLLNEAATPILIAGGLFIVLSFFVERPYCRFVCPTGTLFKLSENNN